ncbi:hypothetical protein DL96DRAFT_1594092 [Flagelloscypha sp. PMI_526]|nr:hypothetical protein DL96DRAFT_1594092 [Flagelloscypha sp. PMI_526]
MDGSEEPIVLCESCSRSLTTYSYFEPSGSRMNAELRSKYAPVDSEIASVRNDIQRAVELELDPLNKEIQRLRDLLEHLNGRKEIVEEYVRQKQAILVPIRLLPFEILVHIFEYLCQDNSFGVERRDISIPAWTLARVCKAWRDLALTTPQLWSRITILLDPRNPVTVSYSTQTTMIFIFPSSLVLIPTGRLHIWKVQQLIGRVSSFASLYSIRIVGHP